MCMARGSVDPKLGLGRVPGLGCSLDSLVLFKVINFGVRAVEGYITRSD